MTETLTTKHRLPVLWHLTWPAIIEQLLSMMVSFMDTAMALDLTARGTLTALRWRSRRWENTAGLTETDE